MKRSSHLIWLTAVLVVTICVVGLAAAQDGVDSLDGDEDGPYQFELDAEITEGLDELEISTGFWGVADDQFDFEVYYNVTRRGTASEDGKAFSTFRRTENWIAMVHLVMSEDELEGRTDLRGQFRFDRIYFNLDDGKGRFAGYIGPNDPLGGSAKFHEILADGSRNEVPGIPGWVGVNARNMETARVQQSAFNAAPLWISIDDQGRIYNEAYHADFIGPDQRSFPGYLIDPLQLALGLLPEFAPDTELKVGGEATVTRRFPAGAGFGAAPDYLFTYKLEKLYGSVDKPTAARFTFSATPVQRTQVSTRGGLKTEFTAPDITGGTLLYDLNRGVAAQIGWKYSASGQVSEAGSKLSSKFQVQVEFKASLRHYKEED